MFHPYHIVTVRPWPLIIGISVLVIVLGVARIIFFVEYDLLIFAFFLFLVGMIVWWRDVVRERTYDGRHMGIVVKGLMVGMVLFIVSELFFFISFFWTFFHSSLVPVVELGGIWPPVGIIPFNPFQVPLLNTVILLSSGVRVTWAHQRLLGNSMKGAERSLLVTWVLGVYFLGLQLFEYKRAIFRVRDSVFGSIFFVATGFHGLHVIIGSLFLFVMWLRVINLHFSNSHHFGFEASAWYWHFVDVVWLFLFSVVYWWGG